MNKLIEFYATGFWVGKIPGAPGTYGSILATALYIFLIDTPLEYKILLALFFIFTGVYAATYLEKLTGQKDHGSIVIDEIAGVWIALMFTPDGWLWILSAFILFRLFDILKPFPVNKAEDLPAGWGVMADDIVAGFYAGFVILAARLYFA